MKVNERVRFNEKSYIRINQLCFPDASGKKTFLRKKLIRSSAAVTNYVQAQHGYLHINRTAFTHKYV